MTRPPRVAVVWCPQWPVVAAGAAVGQPAAGLHANRVIAVSPAAMAEGVTVGLRRREAQARCTDLVLHTNDPFRDARSFEPVPQALEAVTPFVELTEPGTASFGTRGPSRYHGGDEALAQRITQVVTGALGPLVAVAGPPGVGIADGRFTALLAARAAQERGRPVVVAPGQSGPYLAPFPVAALGLPDLVDLLPRLGLTTLGAVAALAPADLVARFGPSGRLAHRLAAGGDDRPPDAQRPPPELTEQAELEPPVPEAGPVAFVAKQLADRLHDRLATLGLACTRVVVVVESEHGERSERCWRHDGAFTAASLVERVRWQLEGWATGPAAPTGGISLVRLVPDEVVPDAGRQLSFWGGRTAHDDRAVRAAARLTGLLGPDAVTVPEWRGGRDPAQVVVPVPAASTDLSGRASSTESSTIRWGHAGAPWPGRLPSPAPATVLPEPRPAEVLDSAGQRVAVNGRGLVSAPPHTVRIDGGAPQHVVAWAGPWLADERWWAPAERRRRARFQVVTDSGIAALVILEAGSWSLEALYD